MEDQGNGEVRLPSQRSRRLGIYSQGAEWTADQDRRCRAQGVLAVGTLVKVGVPLD